VIVVVASSSQRQQWAAGSGTAADLTAPATSAIAVVTEPAGATIVVDGAPRGVAPVNLAAPIGAEIEIRAELARPRARRSAREGRRRCPPRCGSCSHRWRRRARPSTQAPPQRPSTPAAAASTRGPRRPAVSRSILTAWSSRSGHWRRRGVSSERGGCTGKTGSSRRCACTPGSTAPPRPVLGASMSATWTTAFRVASPLARVSLGVWSAAGEARRSGPDDPVRPRAAERRRRRWRHERQRLPRPASGR
jgi:hypothetical protein